MSMIFDIETGPLERERVLALTEPYQAPPHPGEFDPASVKYGNTKDLSKRAEKLAECRMLHRMAVADHAKEVESGRADWAARAMERAALDPCTGRVLAIGVQYSQGVIIEDSYDPDGESALLEFFWNEYRSCRTKNHKLIGCNVFDFDLPFLARRSVILGVNIPSTAFNGRYWDDAVFVDIRQRWHFGQRAGSAPSSLDHIARVLNCGEKDGEGKDFAAKFLGTPEEYEEALAYLSNDLQITKAVAEKLGLC